ncbi:MAG: hypothetical protein P9L92_09390 [Candidatus Electryonea clarkiae]|nr:hypothetical protein [Candidatus Electryonea clarkiae]MDP8288150.1 hypothetical protein [Candidatus Electryonea clarkiae]
MGHKVPGDGKNLPHLILRRLDNHKLPGTKKADNAGVDHANLKWCTRSCEHADWPHENVDGSRSCRTFNALWCNALKEHVTQNSPCALEFGQRRPKPNW